MDVRTDIAGLLAGPTGLDPAAIRDLLETPPDSRMGDYAFPCFPLAKTMRKAPSAIAAALQDLIPAGVSWLDRTVAVGGYLNFYLDRPAFVRRQAEEARQAGDRFGASDEGRGRTIVVEFSSPNIAKPFHVGHAFSTALGQSLYRIHAHLGYHVVRMNHLGDYGTQFGKLISAYRRWGDEAALEAAPIAELLRIYVRFHEAAREDPALEDEARTLFRRLEDGAPEEIALWKRFRDLSLKEFGRVYDRLDVAFDNDNGESFYGPMIPAVVERLRERGLLEESEGAFVVRLDDLGLPPCIVLKSDGATIYASRDLAAAIWRKEQYDFDRNLYVVGNPQSLHFQQVFAVLEKAGYAWASTCRHVGFGLVRFPDRKLSTRSGDVVLLDDLLQECRAATREIIDRNAAERGMNWDNDLKDDLSERIGIGAVIYTFLKNSRDRDIVFSWDDMLDFDGETAPYVLYTYARARSILRKGEAAGVLPAWSDHPSAALAADDEMALARMLEGFPDMVRRAAESCEPYLLTRHVTAMARSFNKYYNNESILGAASPELVRARLCLVDAVSLSLRVGLHLLGISAVERM